MMLVSSIIVLFSYESLLAKLIFGINFNCDVVKDVAMGDVMFFRNQRNRCEMSSRDFGDSQTEVA
jgi:hypothetical protein